MAQKVAGTTDELGGSFPFLLQASCWSVLGQGIGPTLSLMAVPSVYRRVSVSHSSLCERTSECATYCKALWVVSEAEMYSILPTKQCTSSTFQYIITPTFTTNIISNLNGLLWELFFNSSASTGMIFNLSLLRLTVPGHLMDQALQEDDLFLVKFARVLLSKYAQQ